MELEQSRSTLQEFADNLLPIGGRLATFHSYLTFCVTFNKDLQGLHFWQTSCLGYPYLLLSSFLSAFSPPCVCFCYVFLQCTSCPSVRNFVVLCLFLSQDMCVSMSPIWILDAFWLCHRGLTLTIYDHNSSLESLLLVPGSSDACIAGVHFVCVAFC